MLRATFINVGYGEAIYITCGRPAGQAPFRMLVDCGGDEAAEFPAGLPRIRAGEYLRQAGVTGLDLLVATHVHEDHFCGLNHYIREMSIGQYWGALLPEASWERLPAALADSPSTAKFLQALNDHIDVCGMLREAGVPMRAQVFPAAPVEICEGLMAEILAPQQRNVEAFSVRLAQLYAGDGDILQQRALLRELDAAMNNNSIMLRLAYRGRHILLAGDTNRDGYGTLSAQPGALQADVFKLGHHGQLDSITPEILEAVDPAVAIICASSDRRYESIHPDILRMVQRYGRARGREIDILLSDVPQLPPWTEGMAPHRAVYVEIDEAGGITCGEEN